MSSNENSTCNESVKLLADRWVVLIIDQLATGPARFCAIERGINEINTATLSSRLKKLHESRMVDRIEHSRADVEYTLTPLGRKAIPVVSAINVFAAAARKKTAKLGK